ncbi:MAG TPA: FixH family protein [Capillimicrobium sp.]|nr:FixH family protein [Capillimicrobium sp.]
MRRLAIMATMAVLGTAVAAVAAAPAHAGGWTTVGLSSLPDGLAPGEPWRVELRILQHGVQPLEGVRPAIEIWPDRAGGDAERERFAATPTDQPGVYRAEVAFPAAGRWDFQVDDGFMATPHGYAPVEIGGVAAAPAPAAVPAPPVARDDAWTAVAVTGAGIAALAAAGGIALGARRRRGREAAQRAVRLSPRTSAR